MTTMKHPLEDNTRGEEKERHAETFKNMLMTQNGVEGRTKKDQNFCVKAEHFITKSAGDGCASDSARNTGMEEEGRQPEIRQGKPISMSFPKWSIGAKLPPLREMWSEPSARKWPNLGNKTHRDGMAEGSSSQERTNSGHAT